MTPRPLALTLLVLSLAACGGSGADASDADAAADGGSADQPAGVRARVVLTGGPDAGTYEGTPAGATCIDYQSGGIDGLGAAYYAEPGSKGIVSIDFGTKSKVPTAGETRSFGFTVGIAKAPTDAITAMGTSYIVRPEDGRGTGTATVAGSAPRYTVRVAGTTADGVKVDATLECLQ